MDKSFDRDDHCSAAVSLRLSAALMRLESDLTFIEMEARMHYHNPQSWDMDLQFHYWASND
jgi:hypothetical protein